MNRHSGPSMPTSQRQTRGLTTVQVWRAGSGNRNRLPARKGTRTMLSRCGFSASLLLGLAIVGCASPGSTAPRVADPYGLTVPQPGRGMRASPWSGPAPTRL